MQINVLQDQIFKSGTTVRYLAAHLFRKNVQEYFASNGIKIVKNGSADFIELTTIREK